jgi:hypothetical protein
MGPISYLVVEFPGSKMTGEGFPILVDLVDHGIIRILDLVFVTVSEGGVVTRLELADLDGDGELDLSVFQGVSSGLLDDSDLSDAGRVLKAGSSAGILVFENRWANTFIDALRRGGATPIAAGYIPQDALLSSLDATDS